MRGIIVKDTILELWRGHISYALFTVMAIALIQSISATYAIKDMDWFRVIEQINVKKYSYIASLFLFSYIWKGFILAIVSSFALSKYSFSERLSFIYFTVNKFTYLLLRLLGVILFLFILFIFWNIILTISVFPLNTFHFLEVFLLALIGDLILLLFLPIPLFFGLYFSPIPCGFASALLLFVGIMPSFATPFLGIKLSHNLKQILLQFPNVLSLTMFIPLKYFKAPEGTLDIFPNFKSLLFYLIQSTLFLGLFWRKQKFLEL